MKIITEEVDKNKLRPLYILDKFYNEKEVIMFDIETTGFSPRTAFIYLIGINYRKDDKYYISQLFNDDGQSEALIIEEFLKIIKDYKYLMEFNGNMFDIPFVKGRMEYIEKRTKIRFSSVLDDIIPLDLFKMIRPYKNILGLPNVKQKTIERYLGINREDKYDGGQLINVYLDYVSSRDKRSKELVLRHNRDDMEGMYFLTSILSYEAIKNGSFTYQDFCLEEKNKCLYLKINLRMDCPLPRNLDTSLDGIILTGEKNLITLRIPVFIGRLKSYYPDSKDFKDANGYFIISVDFERMPIFKEEQKSKKQYIEINDSFLGNKVFIEEYCRKITKLLMSKKR